MRGVQSAGIFRDSLYVREGEGVILMRLQVPASGLFISAQSVFISYKCDMAHWFSCSFHL